MATVLRLGARGEFGQCLHLFPGQIQLDTVAEAGDGSDGHCDLPSAEEPADDCQEMGEVHLREVDDQSLDSPRVPVDGVHGLAAAYLEAAVGDPIAVTVRLP